MLYVSRAGRCKVSDAAEQLEVSLDFLEQIARKLRVAGLLVSQRGPGGGYSINKDPSVGEVLTALGVKDERLKGFSKSPEKRALAQLFTSFSSAITPVLKRKIRSLNLELAANESAAMDSMLESTVN